MSKLFQLFYLNDYYMEEAFVYTCEWLALDACYVNILLQEHIGEPN